MPLPNILSFLFPVATAITVGAILIALYVKERERYQQQENRPPPCSRSFSNTFRDTRNENDDCVICITRMKPREDLRMLRCFHQFHRNCIDVWLIGEKSCPICRCPI